MSTQLLIGTPVTLKDVSGQQFSGTIAAAASEEGRYHCHVFTDGKKQHAVPLETVRHPVRFDDGSGFQVGERYLICAITGSANVAAEITTLKAENAKLKRELAELEKATTNALAIQVKRLQSAIETLAQEEYTGETVAKSVKKALETGVIVRQQNATAGTGNEKKELVGAH